MQLIYSVKLILTALLEIKKQNKYKTVTANLLHVSIDKEYILPTIF